MKKILRIYLVIWIACLGIFNVVAFVVPALPKYPKFSTGFWVGYALMSAAYVASLVVSVKFFCGDKSKDSEKRFYRVPLVQKSLKSFVAIVVISCVCVGISVIPAWIGAILCVGVVVVYLVSELKTVVAISEVERIDEKIEKATLFIYDMRKESESLIARAQTDDTKAICKNVRDAFKYSDPMSNTELATIENEIKTHFELLSNAIVEGNTEVATAESEQLLVLITERNNECKRVK